MSEASATTSNAAADSGLHEQQAIGADDDAVNASTSIDYLDLCRLCLQKDAVNVPIFEDDGDSRQIFLKITATLPVKIFKEDKLPKKICDDCLYKVELLYQFWNQAATSEKQLLQWLGEVGLDDKQNYEVLEEDLMKQDKGNDNRLNTNIIQVSDQNSIEISMIDNISLITIPAGSEQFTTVPIDASGTIQTEAMQSSHDQSQIEEDRSEMGDMSDDGCDNEGLPVKEESDDQNNQTNMDQAYVSIEAGPSGLQHQKISEISELTIQQAADGDPKTGLVPRVILKRWSSLEIEMYKNHLRDYSDSWGTAAPVQSNETQNDLDDSSYEHDKKSIKKRKKKRRTSTRPYCRECRSYFRSLSCLQIHRKNCKKNPLEKQASAMATTTTDPPKELEFVESRDDSPADLVESPSNKAACREEDDEPRYEYRPLVECNDCTTLFATSKQLLEHRQYLSCCPKKLALQQPELSDNTDEEYEYDVLYTCQVCRGKFVSRRLLELHTKREGHYHRANEAYDNDYSFDSLKHEKLGVDFYFRDCRDCDNEYSCSTCNNGFVYHDPDDLQKHQRAVHSAADLAYYCRYCAEKLSGPSDFDEHHRVHHELVRYCSVCSPSHDPRPDRLTKPLCQTCCEKLGFGEYDCLKMLRENLYCDDCERGLPSLAHVRYHNCRSKSASLSEGLAPQLLVCPLCLTNYSGLRALYRHIVRHSDVAPYRCRDCGLLQKTWAQLCSHRRKFHQEEETKFVRWTTDELRRKADDVVKRFIDNGVQLLA